MEFLNGLVFLTNFVIVPALAYGAQLAIGALGVTLVYAILRFSNFAHGDTMAFGTAVTIKVTAVLVAMGITLGPLPTALLAMPVGILATGLLVLGTDWLIYKFYRQQK
ncbi:MAG: branched-chain amino acid ABC transporter permease, partial [Alphaproteobacteria bacterium]|nr:branched-chain amino acid ABC transporter permease [Alphaproteobacteria bacterium]